MYNNAHSLIPGEDREAFARTLGYTSALDCDREHDPLHCLLSGLFDRSSPTLHWVASGYADAERAHPTRNADAVGWEEDLCLEVARWLNTGEFGGTMRILWWLKIDPDKLRTALSQRLGRDEDATAAGSPRTRAAEGGDAARRVPPNRSDSLASERGNP